MKNNKKGFTLAEMLIVVAIIGVLIAILVPTFSAQLDKAKHAKDQANIRSAIAEVTSLGLASGSGEKSVPIETSFSGEVIGGKTVTGSSSITVTWNASTNDVDID